MSKPSITEEDQFRCQRFRLSDGVALVAVAGHVDLETSPALQTVLLAAVGPDVPDVIVDLTEVRSLDSTGLAALVACWHRASDLGGSIHVVGASGTVRKIFELTTLDQLVTLHPTVSAATAAIAERPDQRDARGSVLVEIQALGDAAAS